MGHQNCIQNSSYGLVSPFQAVNTNMQIDKVVVKCQRNCFSLQHNCTLFFFPSGCSDASTKTVSSLFYCDSSCMSDNEVHYASFQAEGFVVFSTLDAVYILDFTSHSRWNSSRLVDLSIWEDCALAILALCGKHGIFTSFLFLYYVFNRNKGTVVYKTWDSY